MSEATVSTRRIGTRAAVRQENAAMAESETPTAEASPSQATNTSQSPKVEPKMEPTDEPKEELGEELGEDLGEELKQEPEETSTVLLPMEIIVTPVTTEVTPAASTSITAIPTVTAVQMKDALVLQPLGQSSFTGRKRKANFSNEETETLVKYVVKHFSALYGSEALRTESTRRNQRRSQLWNQIQKSVNDLGYTPRSIDDLKHKWRDLRLEVKRKITHRRTANKVPPAPGITPIIDTKLTPMEDLVASTIGHHCSLDGEQEGLYIEPGVPRQSIFFNCRGSPGAPMPELTTDKLSITVSPRPNSEIALVSPLISSSPATLSFVLPDEKDKMEVTPTVTPVTVQSWPTVKELCTLVTTQNILPAPQTILATPQRILTVKQEVMTAQPIVVPSRCDSQNSIVSSPEGSVSNMTVAPKMCGVNGGADNPAPSMVSGDAEMITLKVEEDEEDDSQDAGNNSPMQESQDEWDGQSGSPQPSENAAEDSMPSTSSQDGDPSSSNELPANGDCPCEGSEGKDEVKAKMQRLLELEERWDRMYDRELGIWEEERAQQQQQRAQDRELQQQLLTVLTDIRDELRQLRQERATARQNQSAAVTNSPPAAVNTSKTVAPKTPAAPPDTPRASRAAAKRTPPSSARRRGRPRLVRPSAEPARPIRPAPHPTPGS